MNQMLISDGKYLKPSKETRVLAILDSLAKESELSQFELGRRLNLSGAMINQYLNSLAADRLVEFLPVNGKSFRYVLTPDGDATRRRMFSDYSSETIRLYSTIKSFIQDRLRALRERGLLRLVLFGASETCEVVLSALRESEFTVVALLDNDASKHGQNFHGHMVAHPMVLESLVCDVVVVTSFGKQDEIHEQLKPLCASRGIHIMRF